MTLRQRNRRVAIERPNVGRDAVGQGLAGWTELRKTWAWINTLNGSETLVAQAVVSRASVEIEIRYRPDVTAGMRVRYGSQLYDIGAVIDEDMRHETLRLVCTAGENQGW